MSVNQIYQPHKSNESIAKISITTSFPSILWTHSIDLHSLSSHIVDLSTIPLSSMVTLSQIVESVQRLRQSKWLFPLNHWAPTDNNCPSPVDCRDSAMAYSQGGKPACRVHSINLPRPVKSKNDLATGHNTLWHYLVHFKAD